MAIKLSDETYYDIKELEKILGFSHITIRKYLKNPEKYNLWGYKVGKNRWYVSEYNLKKFIEGKDLQKLFGIAENQLKEIEEERKKKGN
ncbi:MAG: hypothetical protein PHR39_07110 [Actinomycetota bacterium]|jgi:hypothetical protein|nr:hypothetical protein [Actinomycetota bacterium]